MGEQPSVRNELNGNVGGPVVQSGAIHGNVVIYPPAQSQAPLERLAARLEAQQHAEDAAAAATAMALAKRLSAVRQRKRISEHVVAERRTCARRPACWYS